MAKRSKKPPKKRQPPWIEAARARLRGKAPTRIPEAGMTEADAEGGTADEEAVVDALLEMAEPELDALPDDASDDQLNNAIGWAVLAYNQPLLEAIPRREGDADAPAEAMMKALALGFENIPNLRERFDRMLEVRRSRFAHLYRPILNAKASWGEEGGVRVEISLAARRLGEHIAALHG